MNSVQISIDVPLTISSREIAELTGKDYGNVMRVIRAIVDSISMYSDLKPCANSTTYIGKYGR